MSDQQLEANNHHPHGVPPQYLMSPAGGGDPGAQSHMYLQTTSPLESQGYISPNPTTGGTLLPSSSLPPFSGNSSYYAMPEPTPIQGRPGNPLALSAGPHAIHPGIHVGQPGVTMMNNVHPNIALRIHGNQAMMGPVVSGQLMGNSLPPISNQVMMSQHPWMANQYMMQHHGMVPEQYSIVSQPAMGPAHHIYQQHVGQEAYSHVMQGTIHSPMVCDLAPHGVMQSYSQVMGVHHMMNSPNIVSLQQTGAPPQWMGSQSNMGVSQEMVTQSGTASSQETSAPHNMVMPFPRFLHLDTSTQQDQYLLMSIDPSLVRTSTAPFGNSRNEGCVPTVRNSSAPG